MNTSSVGPFHLYHPPMAEDLHGGSAIRHMSIVPSPQFGDIAAYGDLPGSLGHSTLFLGPNLRIYAGQDNAKIGTDDYIRQTDGYTTPTRFRRYSSGSH